MYRIMAVESDGTLKVITDDIVEKRTFDSSGYRDSTSNGTGGTYCANSTLGCNAWSVSNNFINGSYTGTVLKDAELNTYLNSAWFNTKSYGSLITTHAWNIGPIFYETTNLQTSINAEKEYTWSGKVGLMSAIDYVKASSNSLCTSIYAYWGNQKCYNESSMHNCIYKDIVEDNVYLWTITPGEKSLNIVYRVISDDDSLDYYDSLVTYISGVAPVFYLSADVVLYGSGSSVEPYTLSDNQC